MRGGRVEFSLPVRVRWDVDFRERAGRVKRIARRIAEASPLFVELHISGKRGFSELSGVLAELQKAAPRVSVHLPLLPQASGVARRGYPVDYVWDIGGTAGFLTRLPEGAKSISFIPDEETADELPEVLAEFADSDLTELHLPNVNSVRAIAARGHVPVPGIDQLRAAAGAVAALGLSLRGKRLVVHDYFLWKSLSATFPGATGDRVEFSGCQAGTALAYVDWEGNLYPCDSLPIRLGCLEDGTLEEVWNSPLRARVADAVRSTPWACDGCAEHRGCLGGCRGMAYLASGAFDAPDPACPGERPSAVRQEIS
ncbi:MAG TPA: SPASM domain-containing protein [Candidatus Methanoperedens sp.]|nr:SPASM domain-containing protein [Candidatus Methanoperedens sp.]